MRLCLGSIVVGLLLSGTVAQANVKPKILIIFDTSGSMAEFEDGSELCGGRGKDQRLYKLKTALFEALQGIGALEVDFALSTFPMKVDPTRTPKCADVCVEANPAFHCSGHYYHVPEQSSELDSGNHGCKISTHNPSTQQRADCGATDNPCAGWYTQMKQEVLRVPFAGTTPEQVMIYFDQKEDTDSVAPLDNPEVRSAWHWYTPLGKSLFYAHGYFHKEVALPASSYMKKCERLVVALFTDGQETCNESTTNAFYPRTWAKNLSTNLGVTVHTVAIDLSDTLLQDIAKDGKGQYYEVGSDVTALKLAFLDIIARSLPPSETCNGQDDDCDSLTDEDFPQKGKPCDNGQVGVCYRAGTYVCNAAGTGVECNAPKVTPGTEVCNGKDDNCNGQVDEIPGCIPCVPQPEICNNRDDDCDGQIDEEIPSTACGKAEGICKPGTTRCVAGKLICEGGTGPANEVCNGQDDDCDGVRDGITEPCYTFATGCTLAAGQWSCKGFCKPGMRTCDAVQSGGSWSGVWGTCGGQQGPANEVCDGQDNDCDGEVDEQAECPGGSQCVEGQCTRPCGTGEFDCPKNQLCKNGWCILDPCDHAKCEADGGVCKSGVCINPCDGVTCGPNEKCVRGGCVDQTCYNPETPCPAGKRCVQGSCVDDPCATVTCGKDQFCREGSCLNLCTANRCPKGQACQVVTADGKPPQVECVESPCAGVTCNEGFVCKDGECISDPCVLVSCAKGKVCVQGECVVDTCELVTCPAGFACVQGACREAAPISTTNLLASGSGGVACNVQSPTGAAPAASPLSLLWLLLLALPLIARRRS